MIITIINQKGGTGKTTSTVNLGSALAKKGHKVLLVDFDPQGNLSYSLGINDFDCSISDLLAGTQPLATVAVRKESMDILPTDQSLSTLEFGNGEVNPEFLLRDSLSKTGNYDYVLIDCPPSLSILTIGALIAADRVLIPIQLDVFSIQGLEQILETVQDVKSKMNPGLQVIGTLPVMVDNRKKLTVEIREHIEANFDVYIFKRGVRTNVKAAEAPSFGQSVITYAPDSNSARDYMAIAEELIKLTSKNN
jgi:chromosome partitioning protein